METKIQLMLYNYADNILLLQSCTNTYDNGQLISSIPIQDFSTQDFTEAKAFLKLQVDIKTGQIITAPMLVFGLRWSMSQNAQINWLGLKTADESKFPKDYLSQDGIYHTITFANKDDLYNAAYDQKESAIIEANLLINEINSMTTA